MSSLETFSAIFTTFKKRSLGGNQVVELEKHMCIVEEKMAHSTSIMTGPLDFLIEILLLLTRNAGNLATTAVSVSPVFVFFLLFHVCCFEHLVHGAHDRSLMVKSVLP